MNDGWNSDDIDKAKAELVAAGWVAKTSTIWQAPSGKLHLGPAGAWRVMKRAQNDARTRTTHWSVSVERNGEHILTIESNCLAGRDLSPEDEATIRMAARHLLSFVGTEKAAAAVREDMESPVVSTRVKLPLSAEGCINDKRPADAN